MKAVIFDIDGTLAKKGSRSPFDWSKVGEDKLHEDIARLLFMFSAQSYVILLVSGRDESCRVETQNWLKKHLISWHRLYMRPEGNNEKDVEVKKRIYLEEIKPIYKVKYVFDDRNQTVQGWRDLGLRCLQVAPGDF